MALVCGDGQSITRAISWLLDLLKSSVRTKTVLVAPASSTPERTTIRVGQMNHADVRRILAPRWAPPAIDVAVVLAAGVAGIIREIHGRPSHYLLDLPFAMYIVTQVVASALLLLRRIRPLSMGLAVAALSVLTPTYAAIAAPYAIVAYGRGRGRIVAVVAIVLACWWVAARGWAISDPFGGILLLALSAVMGLYARTRTALAGEVLQRAERAEREQQLLAEQAVTAERTRMRARCMTWSRTASISSCFKPAPCASPMTILQCSRPPRIFARPVRRPSPNCRT